MTSTPVQVIFFSGRGVIHQLLPVAEAKDGGPPGQQGWGPGGSAEWRGGARKTRAGTEAGVGAVGSERSRTVRSTGAVPVLGQRLRS